MKRRGELTRVTFSEDVGYEQKLERVLHLDEVLEKLAKVDQRSAQVVDMRVFGGLTTEEIASVLGVGERTVERDWLFARAWLRKELSE